MWIRVLVDPQDLDQGRRYEDLAEGLDPVLRVALRADAAMPELFELIEVRQLDLELQGSATLTPCQRYQKPGVEPIRARRLDLPTNEVNRAFTVDRQHVIRKTGEVHGRPSSGAPTTRIAHLPGISNPGTRDSRPVPTTKRAVETALS